MANPHRHLIRYALPWLCVALQAPNAHAVFEDGYALELEAVAPSASVTYKTASHWDAGTQSYGAGTTDLVMDIFNPAGHQTTDTTAAIVWVHGGGFNAGDPSMFHPQAAYLAERGMVGISISYRLTPDTDDDPLIAVRDVKSAIRYVRENAATLGIDPNRVAVGGGSAGGYLAGASAFMTAGDEPGENLAVSSIADAVVLMNPVSLTDDLASYTHGGTNYANLVNNWFDNTVDTPAASLGNHLDAADPDVLIQHGTSDTTVPISTARALRDHATTLGHSTELVEFSGESHGFFNLRINGNLNHTDFFLTTLQTDQFLTEQGYLDPQFPNPPGEVIAYFDLNDGSSAPDIGTATYSFTSPDSSLNGDGALFENAEGEPATGKANSLRRIGRNGTDVYFQVAVDLTHTTDTRLTFAGVLVDDPDNDVPGTMRVQVSTDGGVTFTAPVALSGAIDDRYAVFDTGVLAGLTNEDDAVIRVLIDPVTSGDINARDGVFIDNIKVVSIVAGDATRDGTVGLADLETLAGNWRGNGVGWDGGDFDESGTVDLIDLDLLRQRWTVTAEGPSFAQALASVSFIPEPGSAGVLTMLITCVMTRRRRHR